MQAADDTIRRAGVADATALESLAARTFAETYDDLTPERVARYVREVLSAERFRRVVRRPDALVLLASAASGPQLGYAHLEPTPPPDAVLGDSPVELVRLYLLRESQGRGIGAALLRVGLEWARERKHGRCWLRVWDRNPRAVSFYERHGFEVVGREPYGAGGMDDTVLLMRRSLI